MATATLAAASSVRRGARFLRHLLEMTVAMMVGMVAYAAAVAAATGLTVEEARVDRPALFALGMATAMSVPMVAWMRRRGHAWRSCAEMTAAMFVPMLALLALYRAGAVPAGSICPLACAAMIPAMAAAMLFRRGEYTR